MRIFPNRPAEKGILKSPSHKSLTDILSGEESEEGEERKQLLWVDSVEVGRCAVLATCKSWDSGGEKIHTQGGNPTTWLRGHFSSPEANCWHCFSSLRLLISLGHRAKAVDVLTVHQSCNQCSRGLPFPGTHVICCNVDHPQRSDQLTEFYSFQVEEGSPGGPVVESVLPLQGQFQTLVGNQDPTCH